MVTPAAYGTALVLTLAVCMVTAQLYFPPRVETRWRTRLRWGFYAGAAIVAALALSRLYEVYRAVGL